MSNRLFIFPALLYCILFVAFYPGYQYWIDPDATGYIKVAERVMNGEYLKSVNGCWSPLNSWLIIPLMKAGMTAPMAAKILNGLTGLATLASIFFLLKKCKLNKTIFYGLMFALVILLLHFAFNQLFGDLLQVMLLCCYLNILCSGNYINSNQKIIASGVLAGIGYYAKYYTFYFAMVHLAVVIFVLLKREKTIHFFRTWLIKTSLAAGSLVITILPWIFALSKKYGQLTLANTGKLNQAWYLSVAYPQAKTIIQPLPYPDSYSFWDDPSCWQGVYINSFTNKAVFMQQIKLIINNLQLYFGFLNDFSFIAVITLLLACWFYFSKHKIFAGNNTVPVILSMALIMPLGYILIIIEHRYVWMVCICLMILAGILLSALQERLQLKNKLLVLLTVIAFGSFCIYPLDQLRTQHNSGKDAYAMASVFKEQGLHGKFISNFSNNAEQARSLELCYLLNSQCYGPADIFHTQDEILQAIHEHQIDHYIMYYRLPWQKEMILHSELAAKAARIYDDIYPGLVVLSFR